MQNEIIEQVRQIIAKQFNKEIKDITLDTSFYNDLAADSLDLFEIITELEDKFNIEFTNESAEKIKTINDVVEYIESKTKN
jgi:acyl carrier protein